MRKIKGLFYLLNDPKKAIVFFIFCLFSYALASIGWQAQKSVWVRYVIDGDTIIAKEGKRQFKVRLFGIDAPESTQKYGKKSAKALKKLILGKKVSLIIKQSDKYERILAIIKLDGKDINKIMVRQGEAWAYTYYSDLYKKDQKYAKEHKLGLWKYPKPQNPYKYRRTHR